MLDQTQFIKHLILMFTTVATIKAIHIIVNQLINAYGNDLDKIDKIQKRIKPIFAIATLGVGVLLGVTSTLIIEDRNFFEVIYSILFFTGGIWIVYRFLFRPIIKVIEKYMENFIK